MHKDFEFFGVKIRKNSNRTSFQAKAYNVHSQRLSMAHLCEDMTEHIKY